MRSTRTALRHAVRLALSSIVLAHSLLPVARVDAAPPQTGTAPSGNSSLAPPKDAEDKAVAQQRAAKSPAKTAKKPAPTTAADKTKPAKTTAARTPSDKTPPGKTPSGKTASAKPPARAAAAPRAKVPATAGETRSAKGAATEPTAVAPRSRTASAPATCSYTVRKGDSVGRVAARHHVSQAALVSANHLPKQGGLPVGKHLTIPDCERRTPSAPDRPTPPAEAWTDNVLHARVGPQRVPTALHLWLPDLRSTGSALLWPVAGPVASPFGLRRSGWHAGVDLKADVGTPILAAAAGTVLVSGWERAYGRVIKIEHDNGFMTLYAHNLQNFVAPGDRVAAGAVIGTVGRSGRSTAYHLHFEVRRDGMAYNPLHILPEREVMVARVDETGETDAEEAEDEPGR